MEAVANMADAVLADGADTSVTLASLAVPALRGSERISANGRTDLPTATFARVSQGRIRRPPLVHAA
jgi:hypothetical protein